MKLKAKELEQQRREAARRGIPTRGSGSSMSAGSYGGFGSGSMGKDMPVTEPIAEISPMPRAQIPQSQPLVHFKLSHVFSILFSF